MTENVTTPLPHQTDVIQLDIPFDQIIFGRRLRPLNEDVVADLTASFSVQGLINPITVRRIANDQFELLAGLHRLQAAKQVGWATIRAEVLDVSDNEARLIEIDENLIRRELTVLEEAEHLKLRKDLYEASHPEAPRKAGRRSRNAARIAPFSAATAELLGKSKSHIRSRIRIAERLTPEVREVLSPTPVANRLNHLSDLARIGDPDRQLAIARRLITGKAKKVRQAEQQLDTSTPKSRQPASAPRLPNTQPLNEPGKQSARGNSASFLRESLRQAFADYLGALTTEKFFHAVLTRLIEPDLEPHQLASISCEIGSEVGSRVTSDEIEEVDEYLHDPVAFMRRHVQIDDLGPAHLVPEGEFPTHSPSIGNPNPVASKRLSAERTSPLDPNIKAGRPQQETDGNSLNEDLGVEVSTSASDGVGSSTHSLPGHRITKIDSTMADLVADRLAEAIPGIAVTPSQCRQLIEAAGGSQDRLIAALLLAREKAEKNELQSPMGYMQWALRAGQVESTMRQARWIADKHPDWVPAPIIRNQYHAVETIWVVAHVQGMFPERVDGLTDDDMLQLLDLYGANFRRMLDAMIVAHSQVKPEGQEPATTLVAKYLFMPKDELELTSRAIQNAAQKRYSIQSRVSNIGRRRASAVGVPFDAWSDGYAEDRWGIAFADDLTEGFDLDHALREEEARRNAKRERERAMISNIRVPELDELYPDAAGR